MAACFSPKYVERIRLLLLFTAAIISLLRSARDCRAWQLSSDNKQGDESLLFHDWKASSPSTPLAAPPSRIGFEYYWNATCPFEDPKYILFADPKMKGPARTLSLEQEETHKTVQSILDSGILSNRTIVMIGDSLYRQLYTSLGCLAGRERLGGLLCHLTGGQKCHGALLQDKNKELPPTRLLFNFEAGKLIELGPKFTLGLHWRDQQQSWVEACEKREPFYLWDSKFPSPSPSAGNDLYEDWVEKKKAIGDGENATVVEFPMEKIELSSQDFVFVYETVHGGVHAKALDQIEKLSSCLEQAKKDGTAHPLWPRIGYIPPQTTHWPNPRGIYRKNARACYNVTAPKAVEEAERSFIIRGKMGIPLVGLNSIRRQVHYGTMHSKVGDCVHWIAPGPIDLLGKEVYEFMAEDIKSRRKSASP